MVARSLMLVYAETVPPEGLKKASNKKTLSAPSFCYVYPLLKAIIRKRADIVDGGEPMVLKTMQVILAHTKLRSEYSNKIDEVRLVDWTMFHFEMAYLKCWFLLLNN